MYNKVILMGRITHDLELKTTPSGANVCSFSIAVDRRFQQKGEEKKSDFFNIVAWRQQADFVTRYFGKGRMILVEGELQTRSYTDKNGMNVRVTEVIADRLHRRKGSERLLRRLCRFRSERCTRSAGKRSAAVRARTGASG